LDDLLCRYAGSNVQQLLQICRLAFQLEYDGDKTDDIKKAIMQSIVEFVTQHDSSGIEEK
jgi:hypothetical protein